MFRSLPGSTVFYPSDAVATERAVELAANTKGITFIRVSRPATEVIYDNDEVFEVIKVYFVRKAPWPIGECRSLKMLSHGPRTWVRIPASPKN